MTSNIKSASWGNVVVTGGGGFLGSHLAEAFAALPEVDQVVATGQNPNKKRQSIPGVRFELCDIRDRAKTKALLSELRPTTILHTISPGPFATKKQHLEVTYEATKNLLEIAKQDPNIRTFIYTSSIEACSILGRLDHAITEEEAPVNDLDTDDYWYCRTKGAADTMVRGANSPKPDDAIDWSGYLLTSCIRTGGVYGPRDGLITTAMLSQVNTPGARLQYGPDTAVHEWLYIENAVLGHILVARKLFGDYTGVGGEAFFLSDGAPMKFHTFTRFIFKEAGDRNMNSPNPSFVVIPFWVLYPLLALWEYLYRAATLGQKWPFVSRQNFLYIRMGVRISIEKARIRLGYEPVVGTEEGLRRTVAWFQANKSKKAN